MVTTKYVELRQARLPSVEGVLKPSIRAVFALRAKDDPYGLAPITVTDAESKPSMENAPPRRVTLGRPVRSFGVTISGGRHPWRVSESSSPFPLKELGRFAFQAIFRWFCGIPFPNCEHVFNKTSDLFLNAVS